MLILGYFMLVLPYKLFIVFYSKEKRNEATHQKAESLSPKLKAYPGDLQVPNYYCILATPRMHPSDEADFFLKSLFSYTTHAATGGRMLFCCEAWLPGS